MNVKEKCSSHIHDTAPWQFLHTFKTVALDSLQFMHFVKVFLVENKRESRVCTELITFQIRV